MVSWWMCRRYRVAKKLGRSRIARNGHSLWHIPWSASECCLGWKSATGFSCHAMWFSGSWGCNLRSQWCLLCLYVTLSLLCWYQVVTDVASCWPMFLVVDILMTMYAWQHAYARNNKTALASLTSYLHGHDKPVVYVYNNKRHSVRQVMINLIRVERRIGLGATVAHGKLHELSIADTVPTNGMWIVVIYCCTHTRYGTHDVVIVV